MAKDHQETINQLITAHSRPYQVLGSDQSLVRALTVLSLTAEDRREPGLTETDILMLERHSATREQAERVILEPYMREIRRRLDDKSATAELAQLLVDAEKAESGVEIEQSRQLYSKLSPPAKSLVDTTRAEVQADQPVGYEIDWVGFAVEAPGAMRGILRSAVTNFFASSTVCSTKP